MLERILCPCCKVKLVAINYYKYGKTYYRNKCVQCYKKHRKPLPPSWVKSGYTKKEKCERCGVRFKHVEQSTVHHIDGNEENNDWFNLKTICSNCSIELTHTKARWRPSSLTPDF